MSSVYQTSAPWSAIHEIGNPKTLWILWRFPEMGVPSGKRLHNYGKSPFIIGKSTVNDHFQ